MLDFLNPIKGFGVTFQEMFRKVETVEYPEDRRPTAPRFHGHHQLNRWPDGLEKCIGCELCAWACPADAIYVEGRDNTAAARYSPGERYGAVYQINYLRCILCGMCIEACPTMRLSSTSRAIPATPAASRCPGIVSRKESAVLTPTIMSTNRNSMSTAPV